MVLITIVASVSAFFFINSNVLDLESQGNLDNYPGADNSRLNLVSITGSKAIVRNDGSSPVNEVIVFINGEMFNYSLDTPLLPGEYKEITYTPQLISRDLEIKMIYNNGKIAQQTSPARVNTENSGFVDSHCPDNICDIEGGETLINCFLDCGTKISMHQHENFDGTNDAIIKVERIVNEDGIFFGNRSVVYSPGDELVNDRENFLDNNYCFSLFGYEENLKYFYYDGTQFSELMNLTNLRNTHESRAVRANNNVHIMFINCTTSYNSGCDLVYLNWSVSNGFSSFEKITDLGLVESEFYESDNVESPIISVSNNENYKLAAWINSGIINYTVYNNIWNEISTLIIDPDVDELLSARINNQGHIIMIYYNNSENQIIYYNGSDWEKLDNSLFLSSSLIRAEALDDSFIIMYQSGAYFNSTLLSNNEYSNIQRILNESSAVVMPFKTKYDYIIGFVIRPNGHGTSLFYDSSDNSWKNPINVTISGGPIPACEKYERYSGECSTETWCNDSVDNDEDGLYDNDDSDCP
jgi:hypothetical protein